LFAFPGAAGGGIIPLLAAESGPPEVTVVSLLFGDVELLLLLLQEPIKREMLANKTISVFFIKLISENCTN
jgi:hypothetical protein